jgi:hypothetical protein
VQSRTRSAGTREDPGSRRSSDAWNGSQRPDSQRTIEERKPWVTLQGDGTREGEEGIAQTQLGSQECARAGSTTRGNRTSWSREACGIRACPNRRANWFMHSGPSLVESGVSASLEQAMADMSNGVNATRWCTTEDSGGGAGDGVGQQKCVSPLVTCPTAS